ncbi:MAG: hypothetical protein WBX22_13550 [Silvibacterium sp.]
MGLFAKRQPYAKINAAGEWIDRTKTVSLNQLFDRMSTQDLEAYAQTGTLPGWFRGALTAILQCRPECGDRTEHSRSTVNAE